MQKKGFRFKLAVQVGAGLGFGQQRLGSFSLEACRLVQSIMHTRSKIRGKLLLISCLLAQFLLCNSSAATDQEQTCKSQTSTCQASSDMESTTSGTSEHVAERKQDILTLPAPADFEGGGRVQLDVSTGQPVSLGDKMGPLIGVRS